MVVIINGEVVQDNDPRAVSYRSRSSTIQRHSVPAPAPAMNRSASLGSTVESDVS